MIVAVLTLFSEVSRQGPWDSLIGVICVVICDAARSKTLGQGAEWRVWFFIEIIQISWLLFVLPPIQSNQRHHLYMFFSDHRCNMFHFCMDIRLRLFSSHYMVPRSLGQRTIMNVSSWIIFKLLARVTKLIFRSNIYLNSACLQKEEHVLARASCTNRQDTFMDVIARWIRAITLGKGRHFLTPWPMA